MNLDGENKSGLVRWLVSASDASGGGMLSISVPFAKENSENIQQILFQFMEKLLSRIMLL